MKATNHQILTQENKPADRERIKKIQDFSFVVFRSLIINMYFCKQNIT